MSFDFSSVDFEAGDVSSDINVDSDSLDYGSETLTESTDQVGNFAGNSEFVTATDPSSITNAPTSVPGSDFVGPPAPCAYTEILETPPQQQNSCGSCVYVFARRLGEGTFDFVLGM